MKFRGKRSPAEFEIVLHAGNNRAKLTVLDVSLRGIRVRQDALELEAEDDVNVEIQDHLYPSRVTWTKNGEAGLEFDYPIPPDVHALIVAGQTNRKWRFPFL